jgi:hypothetical protein
MMITAESQRVPTQRWNLLFEKCRHVVHDIGHPLVESEEDGQAFRSPQRRPEAESDRLRKPVGTSAPSGGDIGGKAAIMAWQYAMRR